MSKRPRDDSPNRKIYTELNRLTLENADIYMKSEIQRNKLLEEFREWKRLKNDLFDENENAVFLRLKTTHEECLKLNEKLTDINNKLIIANKELDKELDLWITNTLKFCKY